FGALHGKYEIFTMTRTKLSKYYQLTLSSFNITS
ncbi:hypothetical protein Gogos_016690, partial [Gossypium gossypioides]|nr:hypothetical protein [Gossypium gossypioides]